MVEKEIYLRKAGEKLNYIVYIPNQFQKFLPMIVFLHGAGERGKKIENLKRHGIPKLITEGYEYNAVILVPQCHESRVWNNLVDDLIGVINDVANKYDVDKNKISITGGSMGGFGTWEMGLTFPNIFSAIAPICGGGLSWRASNLINVPVYAYHGKKDKIVPLVYSQLMVDAVVDSHGMAELIVFKDLEHNDTIDKAYRDTDLIERLITATKCKNETVKEAFSEHF